MSPLVLQLLSCGFFSVLSSYGFVVSDSPIILIICVTFHCLIILLMLGAQIGNKEFVSCILGGCAFAYSWRFLYRTKLLI